MPARWYAIVGTNAGWFIIGIDYDTICAVVICAAFGGAGRLHECCAWVAAQTTTAQTVWEVSFYSTTKTKQYTAINAVTISRHAETSLAGNVTVMKASVETVLE